MASRAIRGRPCFHYRERSRPQGHCSSKWRHDRIRSRSVDGPVTGTWAYSLRNVDAQGPHWMRLDLSSFSQRDSQFPRDEWRRFHASDELRRAVAGIVAPGTTIVVTPDSLRAGGEPVDVIEEDSSKD